jgi:gamma-glutamyltranspeptidase/glutathione hydrolase
MHRRLIPASLALLMLASPVLAQSQTPMAEPEAMQTSPQPGASPAAQAAAPAAPWWFQAPPAPLVAKHGAVSSVSGIASRVGADVLKRGGNAVDAAIAVALALAVVYPEAGNIGGGGFMVVRTADGKTAALDYRETAPAKASRNMYLDAQGNMTDKSLVGGLASGVPGTVAGMAAAHKRYGKLKWAELVAPAIKLAADGFVVNQYLASSLGRAEGLLTKFPESARVFRPSGRLPRAGETFRQPDLAATLRAISAAGADGFYKGRVAQAIAADQAANGGIITTADLAGYKAVWRDPVAFTYRGYKVISMPPPSSGGVTLAEIMNIVEGYDLKAAGWHSPRHLHLMIEAERRAYADRNAYLGDPDFVKGQPLATLMSKAYAAKRRATIRPDKATPEFNTKPGLGESTETTHFSVVDRWGNAVSNTYTLNGNYGSGVVARGTGVLMNNEMDDFAAKPGTPNLFGLVQGEKNAIAPGKRMLSSMSPSLVLDLKGQLFMAVGSPGGSTIITSVFQVISNVVDFGLPLNWAVCMPRVHHQGLPDTLQYEVGGLPARSLDALHKMGHATVPRERIGDVEAILRRPDGTLEAVADPRRQGESAGH